MDNVSDVGVIMNQVSWLQGVLLGSVASLALAGALVTSAQAQNQEKAKEEKAKSEEKKAKAVKTEYGKTITIVGTRIRQTEFTSTSPVQIITRDDSVAAGFSSTAEVLQGAAVTGGTSQINNAYGGFVVNGGPGTNTLGLRGLGASRTLLLINGRRVAPSGTRGAVGSPDLNVLPDAIVDRTEILKDGASSIYGSDAIAGVVNIVTRKKIDGGTLEVQVVPTFDGGGFVQDYSAVLGKVGDRYNVSVALQFLKRSALTLAQRDWTLCNKSLYIDHSTTGVPGSGDGIDPATGDAKCYPIGTVGDNGVTINTIATEFMAGEPGPGAFSGYGGFNRWRSNPDVTTGLVGWEGVLGAPWSAEEYYAPRDTFESAMLDQHIISPVKNYNIFGQAGYDLRALGDAEVYLDFIANRRESSQVGYRQLSLDYKVGSALLPANLQTSNMGERTELTGDDYLGVRAFIGFGNDRSSQRVDFLKIGGGIKGDLPYKDWRYDLYVSHSRSKGEYTFQSYLTDRLIQSLDVTQNMDGSFSCTDTSNGCVAAPALTPAVVAGDLPDDWVNYIWQDIDSQTDYRETLVSAIIDGSLVDIPAGTVKAALGFEYRRQYIFDSPNAESVNDNLYNLTSAAPTEGRDNVWEVFGEVQIPLLAEKKFAKELTINASARYTHYKSYGGDTTYKIAGRYAPADWLAFRASYGTSYRAPALFEQFQGATTGFLSGTFDPCNEYIADGSFRAINCASEGLPPGFIQTNGVEVVNNGGAAAGLESEHSNNLTLGIILEPQLPPADGTLSIAVDYTKIVVKDGVSRAGAGGILSLCYNDPDFLAGGSWCNLVERDPGDNGLTVYDSYINLSEYKVRGIDVTVRYVKDVGLGQLKFRSQATRYIENSIKLFEDDPVDEYVGTLRSPKWTATFEADYTYRFWKFYYAVEWIDGQQSYDFYELNRATTKYKLHTPDVFYHHASLTYERTKWKITAGVRNLFDKNPPEISSGLVNKVGNAPLYSAYDFFGRRFVLTVSREF